MKSNALKTVEKANELYDSFQLYQNLCVHKYRNLWNLSVGESSQEHGDRIRENSFDR